MKKLLIATALSAACFGASAQGLIRFINDSVHLVYYTTDATKLLPGDQAGGATFNTGLTAAGDTLKADLWYGTSSTSLSLYATTTFNTGGSQGEWVGTTPSPALTASTRYFFQVQVYDGTLASSYAVASTENGAYYGESIIFQTTSSPSISPNSIVNTGGTALSTWTAGTQAVAGNITGGLGAIALQANVPEPTSLALAGLGIASLLAFRRRK